MKWFVLLCFPLNGKVVNLKTISKTSLVFLLLTAGDVAIGDEIHRLFIEIHYVNSYADVPLNRGYNFTRFQGAAYPNRSHTRCEVYVVKPSGVNDTHKMEILGHEMLHCTDGDYHN